MPLQDVRFHKRQSTATQELSCPRRWSIKGGSHGFRGEYTSEQFRRRVGVVGSRNCTRNDRFAAVNLDSRMPGLGRPAPVGRANSQPDC